MNKEVNCAIIGTRFGVRTVLPALQNIENANVKYLCGGRDTQKTKEIAEANNIKHYDKSFEDIISDEEIDFIFIATPHDTHFNMVTKAIEKGKNIIVEKPLALELNEIETILEKKSILNDNKVRVVTHQLRFLPIFSNIKRLIKNGAIGKIYNIRINYQSRRLIENGLKWNWCFDRSKGGGMLFAMGSHLIDLLEFISEENIISLESKLQYLHDKLYDDKGCSHKVDVESSFDVNLNLTNNIRSNIICNGTSFQEDFLEVNIYGELGEIYYNSMNGAKIYRNCVNKQEIICSEIPSDIEKSIWKQGFNFYIKEIIANIDSIENIEENLTTFEKYKEQFEILQSIRVSSENNKIIKFKQCEVN